VAICYLCAVPAPKKTTKKKPAPRKKKVQPYKVYWRFLGAILVLILLSPFYYGYVIKTFSSAWQWVRDIGGNPNYRTYKSFNIHIPSQYSIHGIDVSYAQGKIDWTKVKAMSEDSVHISFAFIKASEGLLKVDPYFKRNWREAPKNGIICGPYHFLRANKNGLWQARFFMQNVTVEKGDLPPVVDVETLDGVKPEQMRKELQAFVTFVEHKTKTKPIIYTGFSYYVDYLAGFFDGYTIWLADYDHPTLDEAKQVNWQFWQHSDKARVNGIYHTVDFDAFKGDSTSFQQLLIR
jgi:lysozyme